MVDTRYDRSAIMDVRVILVKKTIPAPMELTTFPVGENSYKVLVLAKPHLPSCHIISYSFLFSESK